MLEEDPDPGLTRVESIIQYITKNENCIKSQLYDYMRGHDRLGVPVDEKSPVHSSIETTNTILNELIKNRSVVARPDIINRKIEHLSINTANTFGLIHLKLSDYENFIHGSRVSASKKGPSKSEKKSRLFMIPILLKCLDETEGLPSQEADMLNKKIIRLIRSVTKNEIKMLEKHYPELFKLDLES